MRGYMVSLVVVLFSDVVQLCFILNKIREIHFYIYTTNPYLNLISSIKGPVIFDWRHNKCNNIKLFEKKKHSLKCTIVYFIHSCR